MNGLLIETEAPMEGIAGTTTSTNDIPMTPIGGGVDVSEQSSSTSTTFPFSTPLPSSPAPIPGVLRSGQICHPQSAGCKPTLTCKTFSHPQTGSVSLCVPSHGGYHFKCDEKMGPVICN